MVFDDASIKINYNFRNVPELIRFLQKKGVPESQYKMHMDRFIEFKARNNRIPIHGSFELTPLCNFDCKMCYVHLSTDRFNNSNLLSVATWKDLMFQAHEAGMVYTTLTGGECLTYPGFDDIYIFLKSLGIKIALLTNGYYIDKKISLFKQYPPDLIQITFYGSSEETYEYVTGKRAFKKVYDNIKLLGDENLNTIIGITPNQFMVDDMYDLITFVDKLKIPYHINSGLITPRKNTGRKKEDFTIDQYIELLKLYKQIKKEEISPISFYELPDENQVGDKRFGVMCAGGRSTFTIKYDGMMCPCPSLEELSENAITKGFMSAWNAIVKLADSYPIPSECSDCFYRPYCLHCTAVHKNAPNVGHCDPSICERTKKMIAAGVIYCKPLI